MLVYLVGGTWRSPWVRVAAGTRSRWRGLRPRPAGRGLLLRTRSVHSFGMKEAVWVTELDLHGRTVRTKLLLPQRVNLCRRATWFLELPGDWLPPPMGTRLRPMADA